MHRLVRKSVAFVATVAVMVVASGSAVEAKGPNGGSLAVKLRARDCSITALVTFDKTLYQPTTAVWLFLTDENTNRHEQVVYGYSTRDNQRITNTFSPLTPSTTANTFSVELELIDVNGSIRFRGPANEITINCDLPLIGF